MQCFIRRWQPRAGGLTQLAVPAAYLPLHQVHDGCLGISASQIGGTRSECPSECFKATPVLGRLQVAAHSFQSNCSLLSERGKNLPPCPAQCVRQHRHPAVRLSNPDIEVTHVVGLLLEGAQLIAQRLDLVRVIDRRQQCQHGAGRPQRNAVVMQELGVDVLFNAKGIGLHDLQLGGDDTIDRSSRGQLRFQCEARLGGVPKRRLALSLQQCQDGGLALALVPGCTERIANPLGLSLVPQQGMQHKA